MENENNKVENNFQRECSICGNTIEKGWRFCPYCRTENIIHKCQFCQNAVEEEWNYCPHCKSNLKNAKTSQEHFQRGNEWLLQQLAK